MSARTARTRPRVAGALALALAAGGLLTGCSSDSADPEPSPTGSANGDGTNGDGDDGSDGDDGGASGGGDGADGVAEAGEPIGAADSACPLPVTFDLAKSWSPAAFDAEEAGEDLGSFVRRGPLALSCEIDAKPAGNIGYLRIWTSGPDEGDPRELLETFIAEEHNVADPRYGEVEAGELPAAEVVFVKESGVDDETRTQRALAVSAPAGSVVLHLGGLDDEEHQEMLPAYELARQTLRAD